MKRKIISCMLVASLVFSIGCYSDRTMTRENLDAIPREELKGQFEQFDITVISKDSLEYVFLEDNYHIQGDTLKGVGVQTMNDERYDGSIPFADITSLTKEEFDLTATLFAIGLPVGVVGALLIVIAKGMQGI